MGDDDYFHCKECGDLVRLKDYRWWPDYARLEKKGLCEECVQGEDNGD